jgi:hypothetical protein
MVRLCHVDPRVPVSSLTQSPNLAGIKFKERAGLTLEPWPCHSVEGNRGGLWVISKWIGVLTLLAVLVIGDQIRINRPGHKYRLTVEVETPAGIKSAGGVMAVTPDRGYSRKGHTTTSGDALFIDLGGGKNLVALLAHMDNNAADLDGVNYVALRAYGAAGAQRVSFNEMSRMRGGVPVRGELVPVLATFSDPADPATMRIVAPHDLAESLGSGFRLHGVSAEAISNGFWPIDFGGPFGEPVTRGIEAKLPWLRRTDGGSATALKAANLTLKEPFEPREAFTRQ